MRASKSTGEGRSAEFEALVLEHLDMMYTVALRLTRDPTEAQDLSQNTILKALRFHDRYESGTYIKAWLLTILRNTFINEYRSRTRRPAFVELSGQEPAADGSPDPEVRYAPRRGDSSGLLELLADPVRAALESLPDDFRAAVIMADLEDRSYKEIAEALACPLGTVMSRLHRRRRPLREQLEAYARDRRLIGDASS